MEGRVTFAMEKRVTLAEPTPKNKMMINQFGNRVIKNWCAYANHLTQKQREKEKKEVVVSKVTEKDRMVLKEALRKLMKERAKSEKQRTLMLKKLALSRTIKGGKKEKSTPREDDYIYCKIDYSALRPKSGAKQSKSQQSLKTGTGAKKSKSQQSLKTGKPRPRLQVKKILVKLPPLKTKPWTPPGPPKREPRPVIVIPPFKTRPWLPPCMRPAQPRNKIIIDYPPLKLRKSPSKPTVKESKTKLTVRLDKTFRPLSMSSTLDRSWHYFKFIGTKISIMRGHTSQYSKKFNFRSNGKQSAFIAAVALVNASMCPMKLWGSDDLDEIISYGDINFRRNQNKFRRQRGKFRYPQAAIKPPEIVSKVYTGRAKTYTQIGVKTVRGIFDASNTMDLVTEMKDLLREFSYCIFTYCNQSFAIWNELKAFYIFNSEDTDDKGRLVERSRGACCIIRSTDSVDQIVDYLVGCLRVSKKCYEIYSFKVNEKVTVEDEIEKLRPMSAIRSCVREKFGADDENLLDAHPDNLSIYSDYNPYTSVGNVRSIRAKVARTIEWTEESVPMGICYAVAMLCNSRSLDPEFYTRDIIDKIILFGNDLVTECGNICFTDFDLCQQSICPDDVNWNFELNNVYTNIQMDIFRRGVIAKTPGLAQSIEEFFNFYSVGILVTNCFVVVLWKDLDEFFIFYSCPIDEAGRVLRCNGVDVEQQSTTFPGLVAFRSVQELIANILANIDEVAYCKPFELRICCITMTDFCQEDEKAACASPTCANAQTGKVIEELIAPAIAARDDFKPQVDQKINSESLANLMHKIRTKSSTSVGFITFANGGLICGRLSKNSKRLNEFTRNYHSVAICLVSVAMSCLKDLSCWCGSIIDCVITSGNSLYVESSVVNNTKEVSMSMLITSLNISSSEIAMKIEPFRDIARENLDHEYLRMALCELFSCFTNGYLCRGLECWALFRRDKTFYLFDPLGIKVRGKKTMQRRAVLYKFESVDLLAEQLMKCLEDAFGNESDETCSIGAILSCKPDALVEVVKQKPRKSKLQKKKVKKCAKLAKPSANSYMMTLRNLEPSTCEASEELSDCIVIEDCCAN